MSPEAVKEEKTEKKPKVEKQTNCPACNKLIKKLRRYYRNGKLYCTKRCWKTALSKSKEEAANKK
ncbi:MAG: hypothetical protein WCY09_01105 [Candidatus Omnitrophota bacterium]